VPAGASRAARLAWCLYDFGAAAWPVVIATFVFGTYFTRAIAPTPEAGTALWGEALAIAGLTVALFGPPLGAVADHAGRRKPWLAAFALLCIGATASLWLSTPHSAPGRTLVLVALGSVAYEFGLVFYNAMLRDLAPPEALGRLSGWGWGLGYVGGLACLAVALFGLVNPDPPPFGLDAASAAPVRATALLVALWFGVFAIPLFALVPDRPRSALAYGEAIRRGLGDLAARLRALPQDGNLLRFLLARMIYADGLNTLFIFGGIYASSRFGFSLREVIVFAMAINLASGLGAFLLAGLDDRAGSKTVIVLSLMALVALGAGVLMVERARWFWVLALALSVFIGPAQSASRTLMARLAPPELQAEMFGLYALTGKITAFIGPALYGWATAHFASQRAGMASVVAFLLLGLVLVLPVRERR